MRVLQLIVLFGLFLSAFGATNTIHRSREIILHNRVVDTVSSPREADFSEAEALYYVTLKFSVAGDKQQVRSIEEQCEILFDGYLPMTSYALYARSESVQKLASDSRVLWVGLVPNVDKVPEDLGAYAAYVFHWAQADSSVTPLADAFADMVARMTARFGAEAFSWDPLEQRISVLHVTDINQVSKLITWVLDEGSNRIRFVEPTIVNERHGMFATHLTVDGDYACSNPTPEQCTDYPTALQPNIDGTNQVVGIADTGVDMFSCYFADPSQSPPFNVLNDPTQRKVVSYITTYGDDIDNDGHGTFVAGLIAGTALSGTPALTADATRFNGVAPGAKLAVNDLQAASATTLNIIESKIGTGILQPLYDAGSRVGVFPWGSEITLKGKQFYSGQDYQFDLWLAANPDFLAIFSVGNNGYSGLGRVSSAASAKNTLGVGGALNAHTSFQYTNYVPNLEEVAAEQYTKYCTLGATSGYSNEVFCKQLGQTAPCPSFQNVLCANFDGTPQKCCDYAYFKPLCCNTTVLDLWDSSFALYSGNSGYGPSSRGPTYDFRIKPDVVAPAQRLYSALNDPTATATHCGAWTDDPPSNPGQAATVAEGTSGAAGVVGGAAALIRQYLIEGYFPGGVQGGGTIYGNPSAALVKALLINSGDSLYQTNTNGDAHWISLVDTIPSPIQGFGRVNLANIMGLGSEAPTQMAILDNQIIQGTGSELRYCITVPSDSQFLRITAVWTDPASAVGAGVALVNNIDLVLIRDDGYEYRANSMSEFDSVNNVEDIYLQAPPGRLYAIALYGTYVPNGPQSVALIIRGSLNCPSSGECLYDTSVCTGSFKCPMDCSLRGSCNNSACECTSPYYGIDCSLTPCPNNCGGNGQCNTETGVCVCNDFWQGSDCSVANPSGQPPNGTIIYNPNKNCNDGVDIGITIGVSIGCFFLGALIFFLFGAWLATHLMLKKKKKIFAKIRQMQRQQQAGGAHHPLNDRVDPDDEED